MSTAVTQPIDLTLRALAESFAAGEDCGPALADRLCELGYPALAWMHFWPGFMGPCIPGSHCSAVANIMLGDVENLNKEELQTSGDLAFAAYQAAQLRPRAGMVTADE